MQTDVSIPEDPIDVEMWCERLRPYSFATRVIDLPRIAAEGIVHSYEDAKFMSNKLTSSESDHLEMLVKAIDGVLDDLDTTSAFVRLSTRSPKDVALKRPETAGILRSELAKLREHPPVGLEEDNQDVLNVIALIRTASRAMEVRCGREAVDFLCHSERAYQDLFRRLLSETYRMKIIIREWVDILPEYEFRGFVHDGELRAVSQYYKLCYVPALASAPHEFEARIKEFFDDIKEAIGLDHYVIDFAVTEDKVYLVELNHWGKGASPALFDWAIDEDVLCRGPFEFRVLSSPVPNVKSILHAQLVQLMINEGIWTQREVDEAIEMRSIDEDEIVDKFPPVPHFRQITSRYDVDEDRFHRINVAGVFLRIMHGTIDSSVPWGIFAPPSYGKMKFAAKRNVKHKTASSVQLKFWEPCKALFCLLDIPEMKFTRKEEEDETEHVLQTQVKVTALVLVVMEILHARVVAKKDEECHTEDETVSDTRSVWTHRWRAAQDAYQFLFHAYGIKRKGGEKRIPPLGNAHHPMTMLLRNTLRMLVEVGLLVKRL